ncbi:FHA domain-containing protein [Desulfobulbus alkaliphilus]|uniref:FHA domain-containing protein n=1 Tax=Desulfobulbus alkaliphilus TaxID=869814 RepID=UPI0019642FAF|nr:ATP-binding cassette domain-containing protein [Desulfobulbus alkaliphilus]MBM9536614.1 ATP-binding cassette domain-containing protein [Desulfobulbus alkaliphilus]
MTRKDPLQQKKSEPHLHMLPRATPREPLQLLHDCPRIDQAHAAYLVALDTGVSYREFRLGTIGVNIGRDADQCDIVVAGPGVSRLHAHIRADAMGIFHLKDQGSTNGLFINGIPIQARTALNDGDLIGLGRSNDPHLRFQKQSIRAPRHLTLPPRAQWLIGRASDCDLPLPGEPTVSARHAILTRQGTHLHILDNSSRNGLWVNGVARQKSLLCSDDTVVIGTTHFRFHLEADGALTAVQRQYGQSIKLECVGLGLTSKERRRPGKILVDDLTLSLEPGEFIGILGPSGAGKTTLLSLLSGLILPDRGDVLVNETPLAATGDMFRHSIGYVPQDDILHSELRVEDSLDYIARLRLPPDMTPLQRDSIVSATIENLGLNRVRHRPIHQLSGGQRKRVSIGAELIVRPSILFLDEPSAGLDPSSEERLMHHFRTMARSGTTVVITTHVLYNLALLDKVAILAQGRLVFYGHPGEALEFFSEKGRPLTRATRIFDLLTGENHPRAAVARHAVLADEEEIASRYAHRYRKSPLYSRHIEQHLSPTARARLTRKKDGRIDTRPVLPPLTISSRTSHGSGSPLLTAKTPSWIRSWLILASRHVHIRCLAGRRQLLLLFIPLILALVTLCQQMHVPLGEEVIRVEKTALEATVAQGGPVMALQLKALLSPAGHQDPRSAAELLYALRYQGVGNLPIPLSVALMMVMTAVFCGTLISCTEISAEQAIYRRERMANLPITAYLGAKLPFCLTITAGQCFVFLALCWLHPSLRQTAFFSVWLTMTAIAWCSVTIGLFLSSLDSSPGRFSVLLAIAVVLPQLVCSGGIGPDFYAHMHHLLRITADLLPARWGLEMICTALYTPLLNGETRWIETTIREVIGFDFGRSVYYSGLIVLTTQSLLWLFFSAWLLKRRDPR